MAIVTIGDSVNKLPHSKNGIDMMGQRNPTVQLISGNRTRQEQSTVMGHRQRLYARWRATQTPTRA